MRPGQLARCTYWHGVILVSTLDELAKTTGRFHANELCLVLAAVGADKLPRGGNARGPQCLVMTLGSAIGWMRMDYLEAMWETA